MTTAQDTNQTAQTATSDWHWVMTVQTADGRINTRTAVITVPTGFTRAQAFDYVFNQFKADYGSPLTVLLFDLHPNKL
ncbi:MAG TPA: hypothetical protein VFY14_09330 [Streptomyces sp.]|nr:hypothetical protein [Streptomyces sp.]